MTIQEFIEKEQIISGAKRVAGNPNMDDMGPGARHWIVSLHIVGKGPDRAIHVPFSQGSAHKKAPTAADVLDCLSSDALGYDNSRSFEDWATEYGYDEDSRKAEKIYHAVAEQSKSLRLWLGNDAYRVLLEEVERL